MDPHHQEFTASPSSRSIHGEPIQQCSGLPGAATEEQDQAGPQRRPGLPRAAPGLCAHRAEAHRRRRPSSSNQAIAAPTTGTVGVHAGDEVHAGSLPGVVRLQQRPSQPRDNGGNGPI